MDGGRIEAIGTDQELEASFGALSPAPRDPLPPRDGLSARIPRERQTAQRALQRVATCFLGALPETIKWYADWRPLGEPMRLRCTSDRVDGAATTLIARFVERSRI